MDETITRMQTIFDQRYRHGLWKGGLADGTRSGRGSTLDATRAFRNFLQCFMTEHSVCSILDAPCGDFHWMKEVAFDQSVRYFGGDISPTLIAQLDSSYRSANRLFFAFDIVSSPFIDADLWICRDCLFHLPLEFGLRAIRNAAKARIGFVMLTSHYNVVENADINIGGFRKLDMMKSPFNLPEPFARCDEFPGTNSHRFVGVWRGDDLRAALQ